ncbi:nicotinate phosphoribosyltransferase [Natronoarchaeum sp. GCM10025321]|uniref:nicotinate phosphoribosyltransferase n=1 Tax=Natronoarchaeum sp. GCM10025321 TaxID=3252684 RepID=UPI00360BED5A
MSDQFGTVSAEAIRDGTATDSYFHRTERTLEHAGKNPTVVAEVTVDQFPTGTYDVFTGIEDVARMLEGRSVDVDAIQEGRLFDGGPVMRIEGPYLEFARFETSLLGFLSQASGYATKALQARRAAPDSQVLSFGARHVHPAITPLVERAGVLAGMDGISHVAAGEVLDREAGGTMPHALLLCFGKGNQEAAWVAFDEAVDENVPRVALCDTFTDEVDETLRAADALGENLDSVRIDTTSSRRGDFRHILKELHWELDAIGREDIDLFVSGGITPKTMRKLRDVADGFGVGSYVTDADPLDFALDIVAIDGDPISKRGKLSGIKEVYRTPDGGHHVGLARRDGPADGESLFEPLLRDGAVVREFDLDAAAERLTADADLVGME